MVRRILNLEGKSLFRIMKTFFSLNTWFLWQTWIHKCYQLNVYFPSPNSYFESELSINIQHFVDPVMY
jgi:hypothetical protein